MKKLLLFIFFITAFLRVSAQDHDMYGTVGVTVTSFDINHASGYKIKAKDQIVSFTTGLSIDFKLGIFTISPGLYFLGKGGDYIDDQGNTRQIRIYYVEMPVNLIYNIPINGNNFYLGAGPYGALGGGGNTRTYVPGKKTVKTTINLYQKTTNYRAGDVGGEAIIGYKFKSGYIINASYDMGTANIFSSRANHNGEEVIKNRSLSISIGHKF